MPCARCVLLLPHKPCQAPNNCPQHHNSRLHRQPAAPDAWARLYPWVYAIIVQCTCRRGVAPSNTGCYSALLHAQWPLTMVRTEHGAGLVGRPTTTGFKNRQLWFCFKGHLPQQLHTKQSQPSPPDATETYTLANEWAATAANAASTHCCALCSRAHALCCERGAQASLSPLCIPGEQWFGGIGLHLAL
jgi:hypothetical protein